jgi:large subunit ribosomal protein L15
MQLHQIKPAHEANNKDKKRIGRGGKRGTYSGHGMKGQKSRAGHRIRPAERDLIQHLPKLRGSGNKGVAWRKKAAKRVAKRKVKSASGKE